MRLTALLRCIHRSRHAHTAWRGHSPRLGWHIAQRPFPHHPWSRQSASMRPLACTRHPGSPNGPLVPKVQPHSTPYDITIHRGPAAPAMMAWPQRRMVSMAMGSLIAAFTLANRPRHSQAERRARVRGQSSAARQWTGPDCDFTGFVSAARGSGRESSRGKPRMRISFNGVYFARETRGGRGRAPRGTPLVLGRARAAAWRVAAPAAVRHSDSVRSLPRPSRSRISDPRSVGYSWTTLTDRARLPSTRPRDTYTYVLASYTRDRLYGFTTTTQVTARHRDGSFRALLMEVRDCRRI